MSPKAPNEEGYSDPSKNMNNRQFPTKTFNNNKPTS